MATVTVTFRTDPKLKEEAEKIFHSLGLDMETAINMFLRAVVRERTIPFPFNPEDIVEENEDSELPE